MGVPGFHLSAGSFSCGKPLGNKDSLMMSMTWETLGKHVTRGKGLRTTILKLNCMSVTRWLLSIHRYFRELQISKFDIKNFVVLLVYSLCSINIRRICSILFYHENNFG